MRILLISVLFASAAIAEDARLAGARQALEDGLPQAAIARLRAAQGKWESPEDSATANLLLARSLFAASRFAESEAVLEKMPEPGAEGLFLRAESLAALGKSDLALPLYAAVPSGAFSDLAAVGQARALRALGRNQEALDLLSLRWKKSPSSAALALELAETELHADRPKEALIILASLQGAGRDDMGRAEYLTARALLTSGDPMQAESRLAPLLPHAPADLAADVAVALAESQIQQKQAGDAEKTLEVYIEEKFRLPGLPKAFVALDRTYAIQGASSSTELRRWSEDDKDPRRAALALFYLARNEARSAKGEESRVQYGRFLTEHPDHALVPEAREELAASLLAAHFPADAMKVLEAGSGPRILYLRGQAQAVLGNYTEAAASFLEAAETPALAKSALPNSAVCALLAGVPEEQNTAMQKLLADPDGRETVERIAYFSALHEAAQRKPRAAELFRRIAEGGSHYAQRSRLALAEWNAFQGDASTAKDELRRISTDDPATRERTDFLALFLADTGDPETDPQVGRMAEAFLAAHPASQFEPEVRMKLGEILYRRGDYLGARGQFGIVAEEFPDSPLAEKAIFLSARAMARSMDPDAMEQAVDEFERVVKANGSLALRARFEEAVLFNALRRPKEALGVLDGILAAQPEADLRYTTLVEKGDTLFALGAQDPANYRAALAAWQVIAADPSAPKLWNHQAYAKIGAAHEKLGESDAALDAYYQVISAPQQGEPEYFWYYKAGFDAGRLLEDQKLWKEAIAVYEKIGSIDGPRAEEAADRVNKLRLENFIWEN